MPTRLARTPKRSPGCSASPRTRTGARWSRLRGRAAASASVTSPRHPSADQKMNIELRLGTRGSQLALWQANTVAARIAAAGGPPCEIVVIRTTGDYLQEAPLSEAGGKRLFVKEIEEALLRRDIDLAVHSSKDMPVVLPDGLAIAGVLPREDPRDAVVLPRSAPSADRPAALDCDPATPPETVRTVEDLIACIGQTAAIGTSS